LKSYCGFTAAIDLEMGQIPTWLCHASSYWFKSVAFGSNVVLLLCLKLFSVNYRSMHEWTQLIVSPDSFSIKKYWGHHDASAQQLCLAGSKFVITINAYSFHIECIALE